jgi:hypothetical protein
LDESSTRVSSRHTEGLLSAISVGVFFLLVGAIFVINSPPNQTNLLDRIIALLRDFDTTQVHNLGVYLPAPVHPLAHSTVYTAVEQFSFVWGLFQIIILAIRFAAGSTLNKKAEAVSNFVFWVGASFLISNFLLDARWTEVWRGSPNPAMTVWFVFWSMIIVLIGFSLIVRAIVLAAAPKRHIV